MSFELPEPVRACRISFARLSLAIFRLAKSALGQCSHGWIAETFGNDQIKTDCAHHGIYAVYRHEIVVSGRCGFADGGCIRKRYVTEIRIVDDNARSFFAAANAAASIAVRCS